MNRTLLVCFFVSDCHLLLHSNPGCPRAVPYSEPSITVVFRHAGVIRIEFCRVALEGLLSLSVNLCYTNWRNWFESIIFSGIEKHDCVEHLYLFLKITWNRCYMWARVFVYGSYDWIIFNSWEIVNNELCWFFQFAFIRMRLLLLILGSIWLCSLD